MIDASSDVRLKTLAGAYLEALNGGDPEKVIALFHDDATVEDPVGGPLRRGKAEIAEMYRMAFSGSLRVEIEVPPRGSLSDSAAYAFTVFLGPITLKVIGVLSFDENGLITAMRAYHGPSDRTMAP